MKMTLTKGSFGATQYSSKDSIVLPGASTTSFMQGSGAASGATLDRTQVANILSDAKTATDFIEGKRVGQQAAPEPYI